MIAFTATECGSNVENDAILCGVSNSNAKGEEWHCLTFQREVEDGELEDWGPYFEFDDQSQGFYTRAMNGQFRGKTMTVKVVPPSRQAFGHRLFVVDLGKCRARDIDSLKKGLRLVFRDAPERLRDG